MATPAEKLADALEALQALQNNGVVAINTSDISWVYRQRLIKAGFLKEVLKGWYIPASPDEQKGDSTSWYANYWKFCSRYLNDKYEDNYIVSADQSLQYHAGNQTVPAQLMIRSPAASNFKTDLPYHTSLFQMRADLPEDGLREKQQGIQFYTLSAAIVFCGQSIFTQNPTDARTALALIGDASEVLTILLNGGHSFIAGRLCGAFRNIGRERIANDIIKAMKTAGYDTGQIKFISAGLSMSL